MDEINQARLLGQMCICLDITQQDFQTMCSELSNKYQKALNNFKHFGIYFSEKKSKTRRQTQISKDEFKIFKNSTTSLKYNTLRSTCALETIIDKCSNNNLKDFPWVTEPIIFPSVKKINKVMKMNKLFEDDDDLNNGDDSNDASIILFLIGGLGQNEIVAVERLQGRLAHKLYSGSFTEITPKRYLEMLSTIGTELNNSSNNNNAVMGKINDKKDDETVDLKNINFAFK